MSDHFEQAVERALARAAQVDRSMVSEAHAAITALPDRRSGFGLRLRRSIPSLSLPRRPRSVALAGAALVVVAVVAVSMFGAPRPQPRPVGTSSPAASLATQSPSSSASPGVTPMPSAIHTDPAYRETLPVLLTGKNLAFAGWSPDGSRYAIVDDATDSAVMHLFDRSGTEIGSVSGVGMISFAWLDANRFVFLSNRGNGSGGVATFLGRVGSSDYMELGQYDMLVPGPSGAIALTVPGTGDPSVSTKHQYVVVSADGSVSKPRDGEPLAWSRDGTMLAVYHATALAPEPSGVQAEPIGSLEVVRSTGESVASTHKLSFTDPYGAAFSPDGALVAFLYDAQPLNGTPQIAILEIGSGHVTIVPESGPLTWASDDQLLFAYTSTDYGKTPAGIRAWSAKTGLVTSYGPGDTVGASGQGTVVSGSDTTHVFTWTVTTGASTRTGTFSVGYSLGTPTLISDSDWSPDGSSLVLTVGDYQMGTPLDAVLFRP